MWSFTDLTLPGDNFMCKILDDKIMSNPNITHTNENHFVNCLSRSATTLSPKLMAFHKPSRLSTRSTQVMHGLALGDLIAWHTIRNSLREKKPNASSPIQRGPGTLIPGPCRILLAVHWLLLWHCLTTLQSYSGKHVSSRAPQSSQLLTSWRTPSLWIMSWSTQALRNHSTFVLKLARMQLAAVLCQEL